MSARVLVVDDNAANRRLLAARLNAEYFEVVSASDGAEAIAICERGLCDIVLLDAMMPDMDGFEVCRRLKGLYATAHLPVVMVTALDQLTDRVRGLEAGADDFLTKPIDEFHLFARVRSLVRLKFLMDEMRVREPTDELLRRIAPFGTGGAADRRKGRLLLVEDRQSSSERLVKALSPHHDVTVASLPEAALSEAAEGDFDVLIISLGLQNFDALRLCGLVRAAERTRQIPILLIANFDERARVLRGLELGVSDWLDRPIDRNELLARVRTQLRYKRHADFLRENLRESIELSSFDPLTGLNNRRFLESRLCSLIEHASKHRSPLALMIVDIDHFKQVNDTFGHDAGDDVLKVFSQRLRGVIRAGDLLCRIGGEEFVMVMPGAYPAIAAEIAERLRQAVESEGFAIGNTGRLIPITASIGLAACGGIQDWRELYRCADQALYRAKEEGRNRVSIAA